MTRDDIVKWAQEAGWTGPEENVTYVAMLERFAHLVAAAEREECAKLCEDWTRTPETTGMELTLCAEAIRERGAP